MYKCDHCKSEFARKHALIKHQRVAKYCRIIQNTKQSEEQTETDHQNNAEAVIKTDTADDLQKKIKELEQARQKDKEDQQKDKEARQRELDELKALITNINVKNPVVQNMEPVTVAHIAAMALEHLDISDLENGIDGIVDFTVTYPLQGRLVCTDKSRRKFRYTDENGEVINDYGGTKLSRTVFTGIQARCVQLIDAQYASLTTSIADTVRTAVEFQDSVLENMKRGTRLQNLKTDLLAAARGVENEFQKGYIRKLVGHY